MAPTWRDDPDEVAPTVLLLGGFLTSPPLYARMGGQLLDRGAVGVVVAPIWLPDWLLVPARGYGAIVARSGRALLRAAAAAGSSASRGAPNAIATRRSKPRATPAQSGMPAASAARKCSSSGVVA